MSTSNNNKRRQPERNTKTQAAREQMGQRKLRKGMLGATPNSHYLAMSVHHCNCLGHTDQSFRAQRNAEESALLRLPPEMRNRIWSYVIPFKPFVIISETYQMDRNEVYPNGNM
jgi:hypothetical protein